MVGLLGVIESKITGANKTKLLDETRIFRDREKGFGRELALANSTTTHPDEWWRLFGHDCPHLKKLAIKLLSQTASSLGCERNWSVFAHVHSKKRNRLEHEKLNDLLYVHYNLRLKNRIHNKKRPYDPIDIDCVERIDFWIVEDNPENELDYDVVEQLLHNEQANQTPRDPRAKAKFVDLDDDDDDAQDGDHHDSDDEDDLVMLPGPEGLDLSSFGDIRVGTSGYCDGFDSGDDV